MASSLTLKADTLSHMCRENFVNEQRWNFISREGGCSPKGMSRRLWGGYSQLDILVGGGVHLRLVKVRAASSIILSWEDNLFDVQGVNGLWRGVVTGTGG
jgi:hypothetical protein